MTSIKTTAKQKVRRIFVAYIGSDNKRIFMLTVVLDIPRCELELEDEPRHGRYVERNEDVLQTLVEENAIFILR